MKSFLLCLPSAYEFSRIGLTPHKHALTIHDIYIKVNLLALYFFNYSLVPK